MKRNFILMLPVIVYCTFIFIQSCYPSPKGIPQFAFSDKIMHTAGYALLGALTARALFNGNWGIKDLQSSRTLLIIIAILFSAMYGVSDEIHQSFVAARCGDIFDVAADAAGSIIGVLFFVKCRCR